MVSELDVSKFTLLYCSAWSVNSACCPGTCGDTTLLTKILSTEREIGTNPTTTRRRNFWEAIPQAVHSLFCKLNYRKLGCIYQEKLLGFKVAFSHLDKWSCHGGRSDFSCLRFLIKATYCEHCFSPLSNSPSRRSTYLIKLSWYWLTAWVSMLWESL